MRRLLGRVALLLVIVTVTAVATLWIVAPPPSASRGAGSSPVVIPDDGVVLTSALQPFDDCDGLLDHFVEHALEEVGPWGLGVHGMSLMMGVEEAGAAADSAGSGLDAGGDAAAQAAPSVEADARVSGTNVQESGVDESDIVKADARVLATVTTGDQRLHLVDLTGPTPRPAGTVELPESYQQELFLDGDRVLVISGTSSPVVGPATDAAVDMIGPGMPMSLPTSTLTLVDVADLDAPRVVRTLQLDGSHVSARLVDGVARVVMRSGPVGLDFVLPEGGGLRAERDAEEANRQIVRTSTIDNWLPAYVLADGDGGVVDEGRVLACEDVHGPDTYAGLGLTTVLSIDLGGDLRPSGATAVVTSGETVYATPSSLYLGLQTWRENEGGFLPDASETAIHRFDISDPARATYEGSATVEGRLLDQWAMSEHDGHLRVATTTGGGEASQSSVVVLAVDGLREVGRVDGLGLTEQIYAVRYMGDRGYVVTFRQTDPLYVIDLADPTGPAVLGELKIPGFSSYLHPVGEGRLLGVGQDATEDGMTTGLQLSLFDVSDATDPRRLATLDLGPGWSPVEHDHRAFLYWEPERLAVLPLERHDVRPLGEDSVAPGEPMPRPLEPFLGAVAVRVDGDGLRALAELSHDAPARQWDPIVRSQVVDGQLLTVSPFGVGHGPLTDLDDRAVVPLGSAG